MNKTYLMIGGNSGIGEACLRRIIEQNHRLITVTRTELKSANVSLHTALKADASTTLPDIEDYTQSLDGVIYCPGTISLKPFTSTLIENFRNDFEINVIGLVNTLQCSLPLLKNSPKASVVAFSTIASKLGMPYHSSIATSKCAVEGLIRTLAAEYASNNIRFNAIAPSIVDTPLAARILTNNQKKEEIARKHPLKKIGSADDIASLTMYLLSEDSSWITGQVIHSDGGLSSISKI